LNFAGFPQSARVGNVWAKRLPPWRIAALARYGEMVRMAGGGSSVRSII
jgi:hypothetical protein